MNPEFGSPEYREQKAINEVNIRVSSQEEAATIVKAFWQAVPHGADIRNQLANAENRDWIQELTFGDRTSVIKLRDGWKVRIAGNYQPLTPEAVEYLKSKGYM